MTVAILAGFSSVILVMLLGQSRVFFAMSRDGLVPRVFSETHPRFGTPYKSNLIFFVFVGAFAAFVPGDIVGDMTSIGTLFAFIIVCAGVWILRKKQPELQRDFKTPLVPLFPILGIVVCAAMIVGLGWTELAAAGRLAGDRPGDLLRLRPQALEAARRRRRRQRRRRWAGDRRGAASAVAMTGGMLNVARITRPGSVADIFHVRMVCTMQSPTSSSSVLPAARPTEPGDPFDSM